MVKRKYDDRDHTMNLRKETGTITKEHVEGLETKSKISKLGNSLRLPWRCSAKDAAMSLIAWWAAVSGVTTN